MASGEPADSRLEVSWRELDAAPPGELVFDSDGCWRLYRRGERDVYRFFDSQLGAIPYKEAEVTADASEGFVRLDPRFHPRDEPVDALQYPLDELLFLRLLAARVGRRAARLRRRDRLRRGRRVRRAVGRRQDHHRPALGARAGSRRS